MKTLEDEAFENIERRQGGGFPAKRQAAMDKINSDFDEEYIKYREAFPKGYTSPQPAQEQRPWVGLTDEDRYEFAAAQYSWDELLIAAEAKLKEKNNGT
jgi:hypothetical protein